MSNFDFCGIAIIYFEAYMVFTMCRVTVRQKGVLDQYVGFVVEIRVDVSGMVPSNWGLYD
jgi:hypothetical protein